MSSTSLGNGSEGSSESMLEQEPSSTGLESDCCSCWKRSKPYFCGSQGGTGEMGRCWPKALKERQLPKHFQITVVAIVVLDELWETGSIAVGCFSHEEEGVSDMNSPIERLLRTHKMGEWGKRNQDWDLGLGP